MKHAYTELALQKRLQDSLSKEQTDEFVNTCADNYYYYDPFKKYFLNPFTNKKYDPLNLLFTNRTELDKILNSPFATELEVEEVVQKIYKSNGIALSIRKLFSLLKYIAPITGVILSFYNLYLGLFVGIYVMYLNLNMFDSIYGVFNLISRSHLILLESDEIFLYLGRESRVRKWEKYGNAYFFGGVAMLILALYCLYQFSGSIVIVIIFFIAQKWLLFNPILQWICSSLYQSSIFPRDIEETFKSQANFSKDRI